MKKVRRIIFSGIALLSALWVNAAYTPETVPNPKVFGQEYYVSDPDTLLSNDDIQFLNECAQSLDSATHAELCIVALRSIGDADAFDFSYELFQTWGIGRKGQNTGVLILFVLDSHDIRIMTGTGIEGILTDAHCAQIIREHMTPAFREGNYGEGLCLGALAIYEICTDGEAPEELLNMKSVTNRGKYAAATDNNGSNEGGDGFYALGVVIVSIIIIILLFRWAQIRTCPKCKKRKAHPIANKVLTAATYSHGGKGERTYKCKNCGEEFVVPYTISRLHHSSGHSSSGGGFSGGHSGGSWGGGSTSGGGAGGKW
ncbi:MAG: TPM domain-containing protein [Paludibacteraceae bacterium]|nr:TPM domain-containing protein [Paludibacteraceae bacterium]